MATPELRLPENVPGPFYVTSECIDCGLCPDTAPAVFRRHADIGFSIVYHQPETDAELQAAQVALESCPTEAIGRELSLTAT